MPKFRKKPVEVEAVQFTGDNWAEMHEFTGHRNLETETSPYPVDIFTEYGTYLQKAGDFAAELWVEAIKMIVPISVGEWIIKNKLGFYPCAKSVFADTYESEDSRDSLGRLLYSEEDSTPDISAEEPTEPGFYKYDGGAQTMMFLLDHSGEWRVLLDNGTSEVCVWGYIEQALSVWNLVKI